MSFMLSLIRRIIKKHLYDKYTIEFTELTDNKTENEVIVRCLTDPINRTYSASSVFGDTFMPSTNQMRNSKQQS